MDVKRKKAGTKANPTNTAKATPETSWAERKVSRRDVLKGAVAATAGLVAGSGVIEGFPTPPTRPSSTLPDRQRKT